MDIKINHVTWGAGTVVYEDGKYIRIIFDNAEIGEKTFVYPDAFDKYLTYADHSLQVEVEEKLCSIKKISDARAAEAEKVRKEAAAVALEKEKSTLAKRKKALAYSRKRAEKLKVKRPAEDSADDSADDTREAEFLPGIIDEDQAEE